MGFFDAPAFTTLFSFLGALCAQSVHIAVVLQDGTFKVYDDPQEGARVMREAVARGKRRTGEHLPQSPLKPLAMSLSQMNELCAKKAATSCVAHMLGMTGNSLIKWGKIDAVFCGTDIPVLGTICISKILAKYGMEDNKFSLEKIIDWVDMSSLSHVKIETMKCKVSRKDFYLLIVETCFVQCGVPMVISPSDAPAHPLVDPVVQQARKSPNC